MLALDIWFSIASNVYAEAIIPSSSRALLAISIFHLRLNSNEGAFRKLATDHVTFVIGYLEYSQLRSFGIQPFVYL